MRKDVVQKPFEREKKKVEITQEEASSFAAEQLKVDIFSNSNFGNEYIRISCSTVSIHNYEFEFPSF